MEGLVKERSLNAYLSAINQAHEDVRLPRPALGHGLRLTRSGLRDVEGEELDDVDDCSVRAPVPAAVIMAILQLGLTTQHPDTLRKCTCIVLNYCWYNRADTGVQLKRAHLSFDWHGITINVKGKTKRWKGKPYKRNDVKKAIVTLAEGEMIDITSGI